MFETGQLVHGQHRCIEIRQFQYAWYVSASKGPWTLFRFENICRHRTIAQLDVRLQNHRTVYYLEKLKIYVFIDPSLAQRSLNISLQIGKWPAAALLKYSKFP